MQEGQSSVTAKTAAKLRAHHFHSAVEPRVLDDGLAAALAGMTSAEEVRAAIAAMVDHFATFGERAAAEELVEHVALCVCTRSRIAEDRLRASLDRGMRQLVVLGAGLDSTAYRRGDLTAGLQVFEVDHPATQAWKRHRLDQLGIDPPGNLRFVPFDFEHQTMAEALAAGGVGTDRMTFFTWMGVQPYLTNEAVRATLEVVARFPAGSEIALDVMTPPDPRQEAEISQGMQEMMALVADQGEPFKSIYSPEEIRSILAGLGFEAIDTVVFHDWLERHAVQFDHRFSTSPGPCIQVCATVAAREASDRK